MKLQDSINCWKSYEQTKDKEFINFKNNPEMKKKMEKLIKEIKKRMY